jgi:hypothetical protein
MKIDTTLLGFGYGGAWSYYINGDIWYEEPDNFNYVKIATVIPEFKPFVEESLKLINDIYSRAIDTEDSWDIMNELSNMLHKCFTKIEEPEQETTDKILIT